MKSKPNKKVTTDDLAVMVARGFESMEKKFDDKLSSLRNDMEDGFKHVDENFKKVRRDILEIGDRFVPWKDFDSLSDRVGRIEDRISDESPE